MCPVNDVSISAAGICTKIVQISQSGSREPDFCKILKSGGLNGLLRSSLHAFDHRTRLWWSVWPVTASAEATDVERRCVRNAVSFVMI